jgi:hypothetical protein
VSDKCCRCGGTCVVVGEPRGHDEDGNPLFVQWMCDCVARYVLDKNAELYRRLAQTKESE